MLAYNPSKDLTINHKKNYNKNFIQVSNADDIKW